MFSLFPDLPLKISESGFHEWWVDAKCFNHCSRCVVLLVIVSGCCWGWSWAILISLACVVILAWWFLASFVAFSCFSSSYSREGLNLLSFLFSIWQPWLKIWDWRSHFLLKSWHLRVTVVSFLVILLDDTGVLLPCQEVSRGFHCAFSFIMEVFLGGCFWHEIFFFFKKTKLIFLGRWYLCHWTTCCPLREGRQKTSIAFLICHVPSSTHFWVSFLAVDFAWFVTS